MNFQKMNSLSCEVDDGILIVSCCVKEASASCERNAKELGYLGDSLMDSCWELVSWILDGS